MKNEEITAKQKEYIDLSHMDKADKFRAYIDVCAFLCEHRETIRNELKRKDNSANRKFMMQNTLHDINNSIKFIGNIIQELKDESR